MMSLENIHEIRGKCSTTETEKLKSEDSENEEHFRNFGHDVMPADCGLDFEGISSPQSPAITGRTLPNL